jgi:hypothetical protein
LFFWGGKNLPISGILFFLKFFGHFSRWILEGFSVFYFGEISQLGDFSFQKKKKRKKDMNFFVIFRDFFRHFRN